MTFGGKLFLPGRDALLRVDEFACMVWLLWLTKRC